MARTYSMTWQPKRRRWFKLYKGKPYAVSCRQLGVPPTKEESYQAANTWWDAKQRELDGDPPDTRYTRIDSATVQDLLQDLERLSEAERDRVIDSLLEKGAYRRLREQADTFDAQLTAPLDTGRSLNVQVEAWLDHLRAACRARRMSASRFGSYATNIARFTAWLGSETSVDAIDEARFAGYYGHLANLIESDALSPVTAHGAFFTARQFVNWLAEMNVISAPRNLRSNSLRFGHTAVGQIRTFTVEEVRAVLAGCEQWPRPRLFVLLMLNCGMYQNDIAELRSEEVDWSAGTVTRARSKTRERNGPTVTYELWPETISLLRDFRADGPLALTTRNGSALVRTWLENGRMRHCDCISPFWRRIAKRMGISKVRLGMKYLRKTSASLLGEHPQFKFYANHFLADAPSGMANRHYVKPSDAEFFEALRWLRSRLLGEETSPAD